MHQGGGDPTHADTRRSQTKPTLKGQTYVDQLMIVSLLEVIQDGRVIQVCQVGHVLAFLVLGRVHLPYQVLLEVLGLLET